MAVHNEVGNVLLETRHYLQDPASFEEEKLLQALRNTNTYLLREYEEDDTARDPLADALELAEAIGVDVELTGMIPQEDPDRKILAAAISECASNTVKHADGDQLKVVISRTDTEWVCVLQNNGLQPKEAIRESGGLLSLRTLVEKEGGSMQTRILPEYAITIRLPK
jgi:signal transduction histidine kinase